MRILAFASRIAFYLGWLVVSCLTFPGVSSSQQAATPGSPSPGVDGPAELPRIYVKSSLADTPAPGKVWTVKEAGSLQETLNQARCGDVIELRAGVTFGGEFHLPSKSCSDQHWIIIRTSAPPAALPPEGTRLTPCFAGVSHLPGRPPLKCSSAENVMAKLVGAGPLAAREPVNHYRFLGIEFTQPPGSRPATLLNLGTNSDHIVVDRCWIHGNPADNTQRGIAINGSYLAVVDSTITDVHMVNTDTQGIAAWTGTGPLKIVNNFIEGGSSSIGFGGAGSSVTPRDIEIRRNHLFKPMSWRIGDPNFIGVVFNTKVAFESKNSSRVLVEGNILENVWGNRQGGDGNALWLGPKSQNNACPLCEVNDITFRYNIIRHAGGGFYVFDGLSDAGGAAQQAMRYSIHDNVLEDITSAYADNGSGNGILFRLAGSIRFLPPRDVTIQHNTGITSGERSAALSLLSTPDAPIANFVFRDNLVAGGRYGIRGCKGRNGSEVLEACAPGFVFVNNAIIGSSDFYPKSNSNARKDKPKINLYPNDWKAVRFVDFQDGSGGDYRLCRAAGEPASACTGASPYVNAGAEGRDIGADAASVYRMTEGVE